MAEGSDSHMIDQTLKQIEERIRKAQKLKGKNKGELLDLLRDLKTEIAQLSESDAEHARSIAGFTDISSHEAMRAQSNPQALKHAVDGLASTVTGLEQAHPQLVENINRICLILANMGI